MQKAQARAALASEKERHREYLESRQAEVDELNEEVEAKIRMLESVLAATLDVDDYIDFESMKEVLAVPPFSGGEFEQEEPPPRLENFLPEAPTGVGRFIPGAKAKYEELVSTARATYEAALASHRDREIERSRRLIELKTKHDEEVRQLEDELAAQHKDIEDLKARFDANDPSAITHYFSQVLIASDYPEDFPRHAKVAFVLESKQLVVELQLPSMEVVPNIKAYRFVKTKDEVTESPRAESQKKALYASLVSQMSLRSLHELFEADRKKKIETIVLNAQVETVNKATGQTVKPCLVTVRVSRDTLETIDLSKVDATACLKSLNASVSRSPAELAPVRPVVEFSMVDPRFVEEADVIAGLDQRPNLMELTPGEFESLITNLFEKMGLETRMTQPSRDGGVDCVAYDNRPIFGGKVVIQAKRYKGTVGVSAVRDLFGTVHNEGASKGILVTTSGYGKSAFDFANGKPLELLDGGNLLYLLKDHAGIDAKIEVPEDWVDPIQLY